MALEMPELDNRRYQQLVDEALARIPVHTPEWTNFNRSDPGVTLVELFAFLAESVIYRANLIPERNRIKFLNLLGVPLGPGAGATGMVMFTDERAGGGAVQPVTLTGGVEVRAGSVPFRTRLGLDVLPVEGRAYTKRQLPTGSPDVRATYRQLYASYLGEPDRADASLYETVPITPTSGPVDLGAAVDHAVWVALLLRQADPPNEDTKQIARKALAGRTLSLGVVPDQPAASGRLLTPVPATQGPGAELLRFEMPDLPADRALPTSLDIRKPRYKALPSQLTGNVLLEPGIVQITLPANPDDLQLWSNLDPLETGVDDFPPSIEDTTEGPRLLTWLKISVSAGTSARFSWLGINAAMVDQQARIANEVLPTGTGEPDQSVFLAQPPVIPGSVRLRVTPQGGSTETWSPVEDLYAAPSEVQAAVASSASSVGVPESSKVYWLDPQSGEVRFGDGKHGTRPPLGAQMRADYDHSMGEAGNVGAGSINSAPALPPGIKVTNPVPTQGGVAAETTREGEKRITGFLQHRDRLVTAEDFETITYRTPGVQVGRVEVLPAYRPELGSTTPGDAPGSVTLMLIPAHDAAHPNAPVPDRHFLDAVCAYLDPRRLVTTEVLLRGPDYRSVWVSVGITVAPQYSVAQATEAVKAAVQQFLSPLSAPGADESASLPVMFVTPASASRYKGWPLRKTVRRLEIFAVANRAEGVLLVNGVMLYDANRSVQEEVPMNGLDLPVLAGIAVGIGEPPPASSIPGFGGAAGPVNAPASAPPTFLPVPVIPEECQ